MPLMISSLYLWYQLIFMVFVVAFTEYNDWRFVFAVFAVPAVYVLDISSSVQLVFVALV